MAKVTLSIRDLLEVQPALQKIAGLDFPANVSIHIGRLILKVNPELEVVNKARLKLCREHGGLEKEGRFEFEDVAKFEAAIQPLLDELISFNAELLELWMFDGQKLSPLDMNALRHFLKPESEQSRSPKKRGSRS